MRSYSARVRGKAYLWGGASVTKKFKEGPPLFLTIRNDQFGSIVEIRTEWFDAQDSRKKADKETYGHLAPGQSLTLELDDITGVYAITALDQITNLACEIHGR